MSFGTICVCFSTWSRLNFSFDMQMTEYLAFLYFLILCAGL